MVNQYNMEFMGEISLISYKYDMIMSTDYSYLYISFYGSKGTLIVILLE